MKSSRVQRGDYVRHFKGKWYKVIDLAEHTETGEQLVVYKSLYSDNKTWARPVEMFNGKVDTDKYPEASQIHRFETINDIIDSDIPDDYRDQLLEISEIIKSTRSQLDTEGFIMRKLIRAENNRHR